MSNTPHSYVLNGEEPTILGKQFLAFWVEQFYENGQISNPVNVAHLRFEDKWYRLYFECGTVFWRLSEQPGIPENSGLAYGLLLNNLSAMVTVIHKELESIEYAGSEAGDIEVALKFSSGAHLRFSYSAAADATQLAALYLPNDRS